MKRKQKIFFSLLTILIVGSLTACGGGGSGGDSSTTTSATTDTGSGSTAPDNGTTTPTTSVDPNAPVTYTTAEGMPIFVDYRAGVNSPLITLNLSGENKMEFDIDFIGVSLLWQKNGGGWTTATTTGVPDSSVAFADGYTLLYTGRGDCTIITPRGETLRFFFDVLRSKLVYNGPSATFIGDVQASNVGNIWLTVNEVNYGPRRFTPGLIDNNGGSFYVGYSVEGGHKWGFDPQ